MGELLQGIWNGAGMTLLRPTKQAVRTLLPSDTQQAFSPRVFVLAQSRAIALFRAHNTKANKMSGLLGGLLGGGAEGLLRLLPQVLGAAEGATGGGLGGLLQQFEAAGLGTQVASWIGFGENQPITAAHVEQAIPAETLAGWAAQSGLPAEQLPQLLAEVLPHAVDHLTPDAQLPAAPPVDLGGLVGRLLGR
jgi:uncharacterized protein YidB (DUF937 family)